MVAAEWSLGFSMLPALPGLLTLLLCELYSSSTFLRRCLKSSIFCGLADDVFSVPPIGFPPWLPNIAAAAGLFFAPVCEADCVAPPAVIFMVTSCPSALTTILDGLMLLIVASVSAIFAPIRAIIGLF